MSRLLSAVLIFLILLYRNTLRLLFLRRCAFSPSCSIYAEEAIRRYGVLRGASLSVKRLLRCHPWAVPAEDPVP